MDILKMAALVLTITQIVKAWPIIAKIDARVVSAIVGLGVVAYFALTTGTPFTIGLIWTWIQVVFFPNAAHKLLKVASGESNLSVPLTFFRAPK